MRQAIESALLVESIAVAMAIAYCYGMILRVLGRRMRAHLLAGLLFGGGAALVMLTPIRVAEGVIFDLRFIMVAVPAALLGPVAGGVALLIAGVTRIAIGGAGAVPGLVALISTTILALTWRWQIRDRLPSPLLGYLALGALSTIPVLTAWPLLPAAVQTSFTSYLGFVAPMITLGTLVTAILVAREEALSTESERLAADATTDSLTGLRNRRGAALAYARNGAMAAPDRGRATLCFDVDLFKRVNDEYGHAAGDAVLVALSRRIAGAIRPADTFARVGGDEFLISVPDVTEEEAEQIAHRCHAAAGGTPIGLPGAAVPVSISMGAHWTRARISLDAAMREADQALYRAKNGGRNRICFAFPTGPQTEGATEPKPEGNAAERAA